MTNGDFVPSIQALLDSGNRAVSWAGSAYDFSKVRSGAGVPPIILVLPACLSMVCGGLAMIAGGLLYQLTREQTPPPEPAPE